MFLTMDQQEILVSKGLAKQKINSELGLVSYKYAKKAMYEYLWSHRPELLECRGHVYDIETEQQVVFPPRKSFNYLENGTWNNVPLSTEVTLYRKYNGFMACVSLFNNQVIVSTTGSTSGPYVEMAKETIFKRFPEETIKTWVNKEGNSQGSWLFEICHEDDPHIVYEPVAARYLGYRSEIGIFTPIADYFDAGDAEIKTTLSEALELVKTVKHEGFMVYDSQGNVCKLKSPYYVGKKKLMRMKEKQVLQMFADPVEFVKKNLPESWGWWADIVSDYLLLTEWLGYTEQQRRIYIENMEEA